MKPVTHLGIVWALCACSGHQTYDDGSDALGGKRPAPTPGQGETAGRVTGEGADASAEPLTNETLPPDGTESAAASTVTAATTEEPVRTLPNADAGTENSGDSGACLSGQYPEFALTPNGLFCESVTYCPDGEVVRLPAVSDPLPCYTRLGNECAAQLDEGGFYYSYELRPGGEYQRFSLEVWFDPQLGQGAFSDAALTEHFEGLEVRRLPVGETASEALTVHVDRIWLPREVFDAGVVFQNGRLVGHLSGSFNEAYYDWAETHQNECLTDDIVLECDCQMDGLTIPFNLEFDIGLTPFNRDAG